MLLLIVAAGASVRCAALLRWNPAEVASDTPTFISMAENLRHGLGLRDPATEVGYTANPSAYRSHPTDDPSRLRRYYFGDYGLSLLYGLAIHLFGNCASPPLLLLMLQISVDCLNILVMGCLGLRLAGRAGGLAAAALYATFVPVVDLAAQHPYTYYWAAAFALWNLAWMGRLLAGDFADAPPWRRHLEALAYGLFLGLASMVRPTFYLVGMVSALVFVVRWRGRLRSVAPLATWFLVGQVLVMAPVMTLAWQRFGQIRMPRPMWHMMYIGFGGHPNPYGIRFDDHCGYEFARSQGLSESSPGWEARYESVLRDEVLRIRREQPWLWPRNTAVNLWDALSLRHSGAALLVDLGPLHAATRFFDSTLARLLLLALALAFLLVRRTGLDHSWLLLLVLLQSAYFATAISVLIPPYGAYNASYWPGFLLLAGVGFVALAALARHAWEGHPSWTAHVTPSETALPAEEGLPGTARVAPDEPALSARGAPPRSAAPIRQRALVGASLGAAALLCWTVPPSVTHDALLEAALAPVVAIPIAWLGERMAGRRGAKVAVACWLALSLVALLVSASGPSRWIAGNGNACLLLGMGILCLLADTRLSAVLAAAILVVGTRGHPEAGLAPFLLAVLVSRPSSASAGARNDGGPTLAALTPRLRWTAAGSLLLAGGLLAFPSLGIPRDALVIPAAFVVLSLVPFTNARADAWGRVGRVVGLVLALALLLLTFKGLASWRLLGLSLLGAWLTAPRGDRTQR